jgi:hypothetical protein
MRVQIIVASILLSACVANRTTIRSTWSDEHYTGPPLDRVAVAAMFETRADSLAFERKAVDVLARHGVRTIPAHELLESVGHRLDEEGIREQLSAGDVDGILIFRLVAVDERRDLLVPTPYLLNAPPSEQTSTGFHHPSSSYYWFPNPSADITGSSSPGYWIEQTFLIAETALFDNHSDRLLWTAKSETIDDAHFERTSESIVRSVAHQLFALDLLASMRDDAGPARRGGPG